MNESHVVNNIEETDLSYILWIKNDKSEVYKWKEFQKTMPITIEFNIEL